MKTSLLTIKILAIFLLTSMDILGQDESGISITKKMFAKTAAINTLTCNLTKHERIDGKMIKQISFNKIEKDPFRVYLKQLYPKEGMEVLYRDGVNNNKALINPNGFPWINLNLNPLENTMRKNQHHTILESGFDHVISILIFLTEKYKSEIDKIVTYNGLVEYQNMVCHSISLISPYFEYIDYTIKENETIIEIASRFKLSEHMILEKNSKVKDYDDVEPGQVIQIPNEYSPKMLVYIDTVDMLPVRMDVYDDQGLYEKYEYSQIVINPELSPEEFSEDYEEYGF
jgi:hypothetical protein